MKKIFFLAGSFILAAVFSGCSKNKEQSEYKKLSRRVQSHIVYVSLLQNPEAKTVYLKGDFAKQFHEIFNMAGVAVETNSNVNGKFDIVVASEPESGGAADYLSDKGVLSIFYDIKKEMMSDFREKIVKYPLAADFSRLWILDESDWMITGSKAASTVSASSIFDLFMNETAFEVIASAGISSPGDLFANYAGALKEIYGAFDTGGLDAAVRPEFFLTKQIPEIKWIDFGTIDYDIAEDFSRRIRTVQVIRRLSVEGSILSLQGKMDKAIDAWSRAYTRNPGDVFLLERMEVLAKNAKVFEQVGNLKGAAKCLETLISINPQDVYSLKEYSRITMRLGMKDISKLTLSRVEKLEKNMEK
jgi:tetratricopeptide (TPR) repeat protein